MIIMPVPSLSSTPSQVQRNKSTICPFVCHPPIGSAAREKDNQEPAPPPKLQSLFQAQDIYLYPASYAHSSARNASDILAVCVDAMLEREGVPIPSHETLPRQNGRAGSPFSGEVNVVPGVVDHINPLFSPRRET